MHSTLIRMQAWGLRCCAGRMQVKLMHSQHLSVVHFIGILGA